MTTPAEELRTAAAKLRGMAKAALPAPWQATRWHSDTCGTDCDDPSCFLLIVSSPKGIVGDSDIDRADDVLAVERRPHEQGEADADYIAAMHPGVGAALAHLLDLEETYLVGMPENEHLAHVRAALAVARQINGTTP